MNYTYGKAMTNSSGNYTLNVAGDTGGASGAFQNYYNSAADDGLAEGMTSSYNASLRPACMPCRCGTGTSSTSPRPTALSMKRSRDGSSPRRSSLTPASRGNTGGSSNVQSYGNTRANQYMKPNPERPLTLSLVRHRSLVCSLHHGRFINLHRGIANLCMRFRRARSEFIWQLAQWLLARTWVPQRGHVRIQGLPHWVSTLSASDSMHSTH